MQIKTLSKQQLEILKYLYYHPNNNNIGISVAREMNVTYGSFSINCKMLKKQGLIYSKKVDGRSKKLFLTDKGKEIVRLYLKIEELLENGT